MPRRPSTSALSVGTGERYHLRATIGRGGMGDILAATDEHFGREVIVKRMREAATESRAASADPLAMERFFREAAIQGRLDHPSIVPVYDIGVDDEGRPFFTMKKLAGITLAERIAEGYARQRLLRAFADVCLAIEFAHARGVLHRDLKPANILLGEFGEVYVLDWGVAKLVGEREEPTLQEGNPRDDEPLTLQGVVVGTPGYMSPEQARGIADIDGRADVYSLGCVLFEILAGMPLHPRDRDEAMRSAVFGLADARPSSRAPGRDVPPELDELCVAATRREREHRIQSARELGDRVQRYLDGDRDLALRQELAFGHLVAARMAFAAGDGDELRRIAMREAGRALALDPKLSGAAEIVSRLMIEPPRETPPEVRASISTENLDTLRRQARAGALAYIGYLGFLPSIIANHEAYPGYSVALAVLVVLNAYVMTAEWAHRSPRLRVWLVGAGNVLLMALLARLSSPLLIAPGVGALTTMALVFSPTYERLRSAVLLGCGMSLAILVPWLAEQLGWITPTVTFTDREIVLQTAMHLGDAVAEQVVLVLYVGGLITGGATLAWVHRRNERRARDRLHLQTYQLRQLAPDV